MKNYLIHMASSGDRWDTLSYIYYADATAYEQIIAANQHLPITTVLSAGDTVFIPIIEQPTKTANIPPWLKDGGDD